MINTESTQDGTGPVPAMPADPRAIGAALLALIAALAVCGMWFAFYMLVFLPRAAP